MLRHGENGWSGKCLGREHESNGGVFKMYCMRIAKWFVSELKTSSRFDLALTLRLRRTASDQSQPDSPQSDQLRSVECTRARH